MEEAAVGLESSTRSHLEALNCLAATAGKLINNEQEVPTNISQTSYLKTEQESLNNNCSLPCITSLNSNLALAYPSNYYQAQESGMTNFHFISNGFSIPKTSIFAPGCRTPSSLSSSPRSNSNSYETEKYLCNPMSLSSNQSEYRSHCLDNSIYSNKSIHKVTEKPPLLFGMDSLLTDSSLFETLVQESQKMLSKDEENENSIPNSKSPVRFTHKYNGSPILSRETSPLLSDSKIKTFKKIRVKNLNVSDKRTHGGPPFKPGCSPPKKNTPESALCTFHEHTLLKMATRGFWSGDKGPLQDVFRLARVENSDLQYSMKDITEHCYNIVKTKLEAVDISVRKTMHLHMKNYVIEFDK